MEHYHSGENYLLGGGVKHDTMKVEFEDHFQVLYKLDILKGSMET